MHAIRIKVLKAAGLASLLTIKKLSKSTDGKSQTTPSKTQDEIPEIQEKGPEGETPPAKPKFPARSQYQASHEAGRAAAFCGEFWK